MPPRLLTDLEQFYQAAKRRFDADPTFAERARAQVVALQSGDAQAERTVASVHRHLDEPLRGGLSRARRVADALGRARRKRYNDDLAAVVRALDDAGLLTISDGAQCVFLDEFKAKDGTPQPVIVQKSDGGYLYSTTDLAAVRYRARTLHADRVLYFVDARQSAALPSDLRGGAARRFRPTRTPRSNITRSASCWARTAGRSVRATAAW